MTYMHCATNIIIIKARDTWSIKEISFLTNSFMCY